MVFDRRLNSAWWALRLGLGLGPFLAGLDKFFQPAGELGDESQSAGAADAARKPDGVCALCGERLGWIAEC
jgi:hypothetical protein